MSHSIQKGWLSLTDAARYVGLSTDVLRQAIAEGKLEAYEKPATTHSRGIKTWLKINVHDIDAWVRTWKEARFHKLCNTNTTQKSHDFTEI